MSDEAHVDGNALGGMMSDLFGREMTDARGCCRECGAVNALGALLAYTRAPGDVLRCPACDAVMLVAVSLPSGVRVSLGAVRWLE
ncbi:MAG TPA: DUF6510 family protein, partial [Miltoncostaeaceae bacterium]|nr:DUF6510 family protein [Miltoncostaeaceae bacterium]